MNIFAQKWSKIAAAKRVFYGFFSSLFCSLRLNVFLPKLSKVQCPKFLDFPNPWKKTNGKRWSQIWILYLIKGVRSPHKKSFIFNEFFLTSRIFWYQCYYPHQSRDALSPICGIFFMNKLLFFFFKLYNSLCSTLLAICQGEWDFPPNPTFPIAPMR